MEGNARSDGGARQDVVNGFRRILRVLRVAAVETQANAGISAAQAFVLNQLAHVDVLSVNELAARTLTDRSSVASVVDRLVAQGLAARSQSAADRRRAAIRITAEGRRVIARMPAPPTERLLSALDDLSDTDVERLAELLTHLVQSMGLAGTPAPMLFEGEAVQSSWPEQANES